MFLSFPAGGPAGAAECCIQGSCLAAAAPECAGGAAGEEEGQAGAATRAGRDAEGESPSLLTALLGCVTARSQPPALSWDISLGEQHPGALHVTPLSSPHG